MTVTATARRTLLGGALAATLGTAFGQATDAEGVAYNNCAVWEIASGRHFYIVKSTGRLDVRNGAKQVQSHCGHDLNAWMAACQRRGGNGCAAQALNGTQILLEDAFAHRDNLIAWARGNAR